MAKEDKAVESVRKRVDKLRAELTDERAKASAVNTTGESDVRLAALEGEENRLKAELDAQRAANKAAASKERVAQVVEQVQEGAEAPAELKREES